MKKSELRKIIQEEVKAAMNENRDINQLADIFTRFLIGNRESAIRQLGSLKDMDFGIMETPGTKEYNNQYNKLMDKMAKAIRSVM